MRRNVARRAGACQAGRSPALVRICLTRSCFTRPPKCHCPVTRGHALQTTKLLCTRCPFQRDPGQSTRKPGVATFSSQHVLGVSWWELRGPGPAGILVRRNFARKWGLQAQISTILRSGAHVEAESDFPGREPIERFGSRPGTSASASTSAPERSLVEVRPRSAHFRAKVLLMDIRACHENPVDRPP